MYKINCVANDNAAMPAFDTNKCCVEHVVPPNDVQVWLKEHKTDNVDKMSKFVKQFGNLALVSKKSNSTYFKDKAEISTTSEYPLTRRIGKNTSYSKAEVEKNTKVFAELFCKAFPIPSKYLTEE